MTFRNLKLVQRYKAHGSLSSNNEVLGWTGEEAEATATDIVVNGTSLEVASSYKYLGANISNDCKLDSEINNRICQASCDLGRMQTRVSKNHNLSLHTKIKVYTAVCLSTLLYGSEAWTIYARDMKLLEAWHIRSLRRILGITWEDRNTHEEIYRRTSCTSLESLLGRRQLRWVGHVIRMEDDRLLKQILYGELSSGVRKAGGQKKRHKEYVKSVLKKFEIAPNMIESFA